MDTTQRAFLDLMNYAKKEQSTQRTYMSLLNQFDTWLRNRNKTLNTADERDLRDWKQVKQDRTYFYGLLFFYKNFKFEKQETIVRQIIKELPKPNARDTPLIFQWQFEGYMLELEKKIKNKKHFTFLNLLWSELKLRDIINLKKSDVDFARRVINANGTDFYITPHAWIALERFVPTEKRDKSEPLFFKSKKPRHPHSLVNKYLGKEYSLEAEIIRKSCEQELINHGRDSMFITPKAKPLFMEEQITENSKANNLFDELVFQLEAFSKRMRNRISEVCNENSLNRLIEGYLNAVFPEEQIIPEYSFEGIKQNSTIDFVIGSEKIPIEVEFCAGKHIGDHIRNGLGQVKECLSYNNSSSRGILIIFDKKKAYKNNVFKLDDKVRIIVV